MNNDDDFSRYYLSILHFFTHKLTIVNTLNSVVFNVNIKELSWSI